MSLELWLRDSRFGLRALGQRPAFTAVAVATLALGIGANSAIFSVVNAVLLRPLEYANADRLVAVFEDATGVGGSNRSATSPATFLDWQEQSRSLEHWTAAHPWSPSLTGRERPDRLPGLKASASLFELLDARPILGRVLEAGDGEPGRAPAVVLGHELWQRRFGADPGLVGQTLVLDKQPYTVVGVMPPGFRFPPFWATDAELWVPLVLDADQATRRRARFLRIFARRRADSDLEAARAELETITRNLRQAHPEALEGVGVTVEPLRQPVVARVRPALTVLLATVGLVLLIACANLANLLLARTLRRGPELALRMAMGAGRSHVVRQVFAESLLLCLLGGATGLVLGHWAFRGLLALAPADLPRLDQVRLDFSVLAFTFCVTVATALVAGCAPALRAASTDAARSLEQSGRTTVGRERRRLTQGLVAAETAMAVALAAAGGLLVTSLARQLQRDPGVATKDVLTMSVALGGSSFEEPERQAAFYELASARVAAIPGVEAAGFIIFPHVGGDLWSFPLSFHDRPEGAPNAGPTASVKVVSTRLFASLGIPVLRGRAFSARDTGDSEPVVVVNERLATRFWPGQDALDARIKVGGGAWLRVIGVVGDVVQDDLTHEVLPEAYFPYSQSPVGFYTSATLVARAAPRAGLVAAISEAVWQIDRQIPVTNLRPMEAILARTLQRARFTALLVGVFAAVSVLLAAVGLYGVVSYGVGSRRREFAIRRALGARPWRILWMVAREGLRVGGVGVGLGLACALMLGGVLESLLFEVDAHDPIVLAAVAGLVLFVSLVSSSVAARGAVRDGLARTLQG